MKKKKKKRKMPCFKVTIVSLSRLNLLSIILLSWLLSWSENVAGLVDHTVENSEESSLMISKYYTFYGANSQIKLIANKNITDKFVHSKKQINFNFRTRYPNGLLFYESFYLANNHWNTIFELSLMINHGRLKVVITSDAHQQGFTVGHGFNDDRLHFVRMYMNLDMGFFNIRFNSTYEPEHYKSISFNSTIIKQSLMKSNYHLILGGVRSLALVDDKPFIGCIGNLSVQLRSTGNNFDTLSSMNLEFSNVKEGCIDQCEKNLCSRKSKCINFYDTNQCNCFTTELEDWHCRSFNYTMITMRGYSSISYQIYKFADRYSMDEVLISFHLKTSHNGLLLVALQENSQDNSHSYLIINIKNGFLNLLFDLGNAENTNVAKKPNSEKNPKNYLLNNCKLTDNQWHNVTIWKIHRKIFVHLDNSTKQVITLKDSEPFFFYFDPEIFIGGLPSYMNLSQLNLPFYLANQKYIGCLKHVYFNHHNILYDLARNSKVAKYHSVLPLELGCQPTDSIPMTFYSQSYFSMNFNQTENLLLKFKFKSIPNEFRIVRGTFQTENKEKNVWSLFIRNHDVKLEIEKLGSVRNQIGWILSNDNSLNFTGWNEITIFFRMDGFIEMTANELLVKGRFDSLVDFFFGDLDFGSIDGRMKFIGCVKDIVLNQDFIDPRTLSERAKIHGRISLDDCQLVNPCKRPNPCQHDGVCIPYIENGSYSCDCSNTGYTGKTCHFSLYRKSCEEIHLMDKQNSGIYLIDIDRNGPSPPAHVICDISNEPDGNITINTVIEHNIPHQVVVREKGKQGNYYMDVFYRDFDKKMLRFLIQRSKQCEQYIRYECNNAPLGLSTYTLIYSNKPEHKLIRLDSSKTKGCKCGGSDDGRQTSMCVDPGKNCNCDAMLPGWRHDEGHLTHPDDVGIMKMFFLPFPNASWDSEAHLYLGNLSCQDLNTQRYEITFKTKESYLAVDGWSGKEMAISFKTTANETVIFYQSHLNTTHTYFKAMIISENEISFEYSARNRKLKATLSSSRCLNCGQWQHILIERNDNQMRVSINQNSKILHLNQEENFIDFDGKLYVGGAPLRYLKGLKINLGFIGCLRGLVLDNQVIDLHRYLNIIRNPNIEPGCRPYCRPNLCQNQGVCIELWGSYRCKCANQIAHSGYNCQININTNAITLKSETYIRKELSSQEIRNILRKDIILSFRTHQHSALLLYAHDVFNNFIQVHIDNGSSVVLIYNHHQKIITQQIMIGRNLITGIPVQIKIEKHHRNNTIFIVDKNSLTIPYPGKLIKEHVTTNIGQTKWFHDNDDNNDIRLVGLATSGGSSSSSSSNELFIGGIPNTTLELFPNRLPGFVGCIQGIVVGGQLLDIEKMAQDLAQNETSEQKDRIKPGCKMLCDEMPCNNGGICTEDWQHESTICDCEVTSYRGETCSIDIGALFQKDSSVIYYLDDKIMDFNHIDISFAFSTASGESSATMLMILYANSTRFLHIALLSNGKLSVEEDNGHEIYSEIIESEEDSFFDSYRHWVRYTRTGKSAKIIVDSIIYVVYEDYLKDFPRNMPQTKDNIIMIGSNKVNNQNFSSFSSFRGCISNTDIVLDELKIDPLESAFGIRSGLSDVKVNGPIKQGICASFRLQHKTDVPFAEQPKILPFRKEIWLNRPKPSLVAFKMNYTQEEDKSLMSTSNIVIIVSSIYLALIISCVSIYLWKIEKRYRLLKFQGETPFFHKNQVIIEKNYKM